MYIMYMYCQREQKLKEKQHFNNSPIGNIEVPRVVNGNAGRLAEVSKTTAWFERCAKDHSRL
jgi:hypothetical protein